MTKFQLKYTIQFLLLYPALAWLFVNSFQGFTRLILHIYANEEIIWNGYSELERMDWVAILYLVHFSTTLLSSLVLKTLEKSSNTSLFGFAILLTLSAVYRVITSIPSDYSTQLLFSSWSIAWQNELIPYGIEIIITWMAVYTSFKILKHMKKTSA